MTSIRTYLISPKQSLPQVYAANGTEQFTKLFITLEQFTKQYSLDTVGPLKSNDINMAVVIQRGQEQLIGFENWGLDLWGSYLSVMHKYLKSNCIYGESLYGSEPILICFKKDTMGTMEIILRIDYDYMNEEKVIQRFHVEESKFLHHLFDSAIEYYGSMDKCGIITNKKVEACLFETREMLKQISR
ncbi:MULTISPECIES: hypothetical protein [Paenibacillus]|uniref:hypothetical protein n=1 Tax=Paenibacillus TaxID=44249 RepID=UPI001F4421EB|nr:MULTISPECIES: hypothetical protein [Paenibacillus]MCF7753209.1 hypothetical protein [Paenibacillus xylanexedens]MDQ0661463.1 hypothetical protein [Paenibacillus sp. W2I17]